ncbi:hypothetical protein PX699_00045 [Sphingobium sp. H39-3-25]|uniref:hypothetical protein n=1 Tax=Sphingobium arseniciresistens TaxID=3030834 RepID=UPI0023B9D635|nr:hypothetical protein [Sphingobium arseniciresistens]
MRGFRLAMTALLVLLPAPALAAGGAHIVDDAAVEEPGQCHFENWATLASGHAGLANVSPACTLRSLPMVELGGFIAHGWTLDNDDTLIGLSPKLMLRSEDRGIGVGIATSLAYGIDRRRLETASAIAALTVPASMGLRINLNGGWQWSRIGTKHDLFVGAQAEVALTDNLIWMGEAFARAQGKMGEQVGLRWTSAGGGMDIDLLAGRYLDGATPNAVTLGITLRP